MPLNIMGQMAVGDRIEQLFREYGVDDQSSGRGSNGDVPKGVVTVGPLVAEPPPQPPSPISVSAPVPAPVPVAVMTPETAAAHIARMLEPRYVGHGRYFQPLPWFEGGPDWSWAAGGNIDISPYLNVCR